MLEHEQLSLDGFPGGTSPAPKRALVLQAVGPVADQLAFGADDKALVVADDGLFARLVHRHSARKAYYVRRYAEIVATAMAPHWPQIWWVELFAGPGRLKEVESDRFLPGSPIEALTIPSRFTGYVFADLSESCVDCLRQRAAGHKDVRGEPDRAGDDTEPRANRRGDPRPSPQVEAIPSGCRIEHDGLRPGVEDAHRGV